MAKRYVNQLVEKEAVDEVFLVNEKQLRSNRSGNLYLQLRLADRTGSFTGMLWNANEKIAATFGGGDYVRIQGTSQFYNGQLQVILTRVVKVEAAEVDPTDFVVLGTEELDALIAKLRERIAAIRDVHLRSLGEVLLADETLIGKLRTAPAGIKNHHAYRGGLLEHVVSVIGLADRTADHYPRLDRDLLMIGALWHDLGKLDELTYDRELGYSEAGQLLGHVVIGVRMLDERLPAAAQRSGMEFPETLANRIRHLILSHHGEYEFGSPKLPMMPEAMALHLIDNLDAKLHHFFQLIDEDPNPESPWTAYQPALGRKIYKGTAAG
ncbi:MAG TPA: CMP-binding protein [Planctomycetaceae bacterium]|nr:CMP-binding protein [Planctomycetaceae bacterium]HRF02350.1 HD domain-containing protein [Pirellulaceae bacterium]